MDILEIVLFLVFYKSDIRYILGVGFIIVCSVGVSVFFYSIFILGLFVVWSILVWCSCKKFDVCYLRQF